MVAVEDNLRCPESKRWKLCAIEPGDEVSIVSGSRFTGENLPAVDDHEIGAAWVFAASDDIQHADCANRQAGFFPAFAFGGAGRILVSIDEPGWQ